MENNTKIQSKQHKYNRMTKNDLINIIREKDHRIKMLVQYPETEEGLEIYLEEKGKYEK